MRACARMCVCVGEIKININKIIISFLFDNPFQIDLI